MGAWENGVRERRVIPFSGREFEEKGEDLEKSPRRRKGAALPREGKGCPAVLGARSTSFGGFTHQTLRATRLASFIPLSQDNLVNSQHIVTE